MTSVDLVKIRTLNQRKDKLDEVAEQMKVPFQTLHSPLYLPFLSTKSVASIYMHVI